MTWTIEGIRNVLRRWMLFFKVSLSRARVMTPAGITKDSLSYGEVDLCAVCSLRALANSDLCVKCDRLCICGMCA